jgi:hypothetical protein
MATINAYARIDANITPRQFLRLERQLLSGAPPVRRVPAPKPMGRPRKKPSDPLPMHSYASREWRTP